MNVRSIKYLFPAAIAVAVLLAPAVVTAAAQLPPGNRTYEHILAATKAYYAAWSYTRDDEVYDQAGRFYAKSPNNVYWDPLPPLAGYRGWTEYQTVIADVWKPAGIVAAAILLAHDGSFRAWRHDDVVWTTANCLVYAEYASGASSATMPCRGLQIWTLQDSAWLIVHEHYSGAVYPPAKLFHSPRKADPRIQTDGEFAGIAARLAAAWSSGPMGRAAVRLKEFYDVGGAGVNLYMPWAPHDGYTSWRDFETGLTEYASLFTNRLQLTYNNDVEATRRGALAWSTATVNMQFQPARGEPVPASGRQTLIWLKRDDGWRIVHEHLSIPATHWELP